MIFTALAVPHNFRSLKLKTSMKATEQLHHMGHSHQDHRPYWKRAHHDWRFWVGLFLMFTAIFVYVGTDDLSLVPSGRQKELPPAVSRVP